MPTVNKSQLRVPFGLRNGVLCAPADITETGLACNCTCPGCGSALVLRQGNKRKHFAHHVATWSLHCVESAIHAAAVQVLMQANWMRVPEKYVNAAIRTKSGVRHAKFTVIRPERIIRFEYCKKEQTFHGQGGRTLRADVVGFRGEKQLLVEMCFTHAVDAEKHSLIRELGLPALEIDLGDIDLDAGLEAVRQRVLEDIAQKEWLFHPGEDEARAALLVEVEMEVAQINADYDARQAREEQQRQARTARKQEQQRQVQEAIERYRALPQTEKEQRLREQLGIRGAWPRHLQVMNAKNDAVAAPARLWQASLFHRYVYEKPIDDFSFTLEQATQWVGERFGYTTGSGFSVTDAVRAFLAYLKGCGFVERQYNPYGSDSFVVRSNQLMPAHRHKT